MRVKPHRLHLPRSVLGPACIHFLVVSRRARSAQRNRSVGIRFASELPIEGVGSAGTLKFNPVEGLAREAPEAIAEELFEVPTLGPFEIEWGGGVADHWRG